MKLCDFGFARSVASPSVDPFGPYPAHGLGSVSDSLDVLKRPVLTEYVGSRWYKAPEMLMNAKKYVQMKITMLLIQSYILKPIFDHDQSDFFF